MSTAAEAVAAAATADDVLGTWFPEEAFQPWWFRSSDEMDERLRVTLGPLSEQAVQGKLDHWADEGPQSALALLILLDQVPRNINRGSATAFAGDALALAVSKRGIEHSWWDELPAPQRMFTLLPLQHAEDLEAQELSVQQSKALGMDMLTDYAQKHYDIIKQFGRFPHRNAALGRESTADEVEYLRSADRFGQ